MMVVNRKVSFTSPIPHAVDEPAQQHLTRDERKCLWYSREELTNSCLEAKEIVQIINQVNGDYAAIDHSKVCVVGLEKFHGKRERDKYRKLLVKAVLARQEINRGLGKRDSDCRCEVSTVISNSFKEFALWQAAMHKFHASSPDEPSKKPSKQYRNEMISTVHLAKRRRIGSDFDISSLGRISPQSMYNSWAGSSGSAHDDMHKMMAGFCS